MSSQSNQRTLGDPIRRVRGQPWVAVARVTVLSFVLLWLGAMLSYPGWNSFDAESVGHDFFRNFLCDVLSAETPLGRSNRLGSALMGTGVLILVGGALWPLWWHVPVRNPWRAMCRVLGSLAAILTMVICIEQAFALNLSHNAITLAAGAAGLIPTAMVAITDWRGADATPLRRLLLSGTLVAALVNYVSYSMVQSGFELTPVVPTAQKVALICLLAWLFLKPATNHD